MYGLKDNLESETDNNAPQSGKFGKCTVHHILKGKVCFQANSFVKKSLSKCTCIVYILYTICIKSEIRERKTMNL